MGRDRDLPNGYDDIMPRDIDLERMKQSLKDSDQDQELYGNVSDTDE